MFSLKTIGAGLSAITLNYNFNALVDYVNSKMLKLDPEAGQDNVMKADLDMNNNDLLNVKTLNVQDFSIAGQGSQEGFLAAAQAAADAAATSATQASSSAADAAASSVSSSTSATASADSLQDFTNRYYGPLSAEPSTRPDGTPSVTGDLYWDSGTNKMRVYNSPAWQDFIASSVNWADVIGPPDEATRWASWGEITGIPPSLTPVTTLADDPAASNVVTVKQLFQVANNITESGSRDYVIQTLKTDAGADITFDSIVPDMGGVYGGYAGFVGLKKTGSSIYAHYYSLSSGFPWKPPLIVQTVATGVASSGLAGAILQDNLVVCTSSGETWVGDYSTGPFMTASGLPTSNKMNLLSISLDSLLCIYVDASYDTKAAVYTLSGTTFTQVGSTLTLSTTDQYSSICPTELLYSTHGTGATDPKTFAVCFSGTSDTIRKLSWSGSALSQSSDVTIPSRDWGISDVPSLSFSATGLVRVHHGGYRLCDYYDMSGSAPVLKDTKPSRVKVNSTLFTTSVADGCVATEGAIWSMRK